MKFLYLALVAALMGVLWCAADITKPVESGRFAPIPKAPEGDEVITLGAGCFWRMGDILEHIPGVVSVTAGYMGGTTKNPTYEQVCSGNTGHTEVSRVVFDPKRTSLEKILQAFWAAQHPAMPGSTHARSVIFYNTDNQRKPAEELKTALSRQLSAPIITEIAKAGEFYAAEEYHQNYYQKHGNSCRMVASPDLQTSRLKK